MPNANAAPARKRSFWRVHLMTLVVSALASGLILWANLVLGGIQYKNRLSSLEYQRTGLRVWKSAAFARYGFPLHAIDVYAFDNSTEIWVDLPLHFHVTLGGYTLLSDDLGSIYRLGTYLDLIVNGVIFFGAAGACEWWLRRRERKRTA